MSQDKDRISGLPDEALPEITELPGDLSLVAEVIGVRMTLALVERLRGTYVYFRNLDHLTRTRRDDFIRAEIDRRINTGETITKAVQDLARAHGLSSRHVWSISGSTGQEDDSQQLKIFG
ncbi:MAG: hypothetical protein OEY01_10815 [Desulfobulbaceae bacterium]|nr:hypothetical protein [Desulfobulbaceae bacterium]